MQVCTSGIVIKENTIRDKDKVITVLTPDLGKISVWAKSVKTTKSKNLSSCQLMAYSKFTLNYVNDYYYLVDSNVQNVFFGLRDSIEKLSLSQYFCEVCNLISADSHNSTEVLSLILNSLYLLCKKSADIFLVKAVFEMRMMSVCGFMPDLGACFLCGKKTGEMYFDVKEGRLICGSCNEIKNEKQYFLLNHALIEALRHIIYAPPKKIFSFRLEDRAKEQLCKICESFCLFQLDYKFKALDFFWSLAHFSYGGENDTERTANI